MVDLRSLMGYSKGSPWENAPYNLIKTSDGRITMTNTKKKLKAFDAKTGKFLSDLEPGKEYKFPTNQILEVPSFQNGGIKYIPFVNSEKALSPSVDNFRKNQDVIDWNNYIDSPEYQNKVKAQAQQTQVAPTKKLSDSEKVKAKEQKIRLNSEYIQNKQHLSLDNEGNILNNSKYLNMDGTSKPHTPAAQRDKGFEGLLHAGEATMLLDGIPQVYDLGKSFFRQAPRSTQVITRGPINWEDAVNRVDNPNFNAQTYLNNAGGQGYVSPTIDPKLMAKLIKPKKSYKSEIDWGKWNKEIPDNKALVQEYNNIEQTTKANGSWMKNPDSTPFIGTNPTKEELLKHGVDMTSEQAIQAQFIQQNSKNIPKNVIKNASGSVQGNYHASKTLDITEFKEEYFNKGAGKGLFGKGNYTTKDKDYAKQYLDLSKKDKTISDDKLYSFYINSKNPVSANANNLIKDYGLGTKDIFKNIDEFPTRQQLAEKYNLTGNKDEIIDKLLSFKNQVPREVKKIPFKENDYLEILGMRSGQEQVTPFNNYLKSAIGNNGMFNMTNPNIYKALIPPTVGAGLLSQQEKPKKGFKEGGQINMNTLKKYQSGSSYFDKTGYNYNTSAFKKLNPLFQDPLIDMSKYMLTPQQEADNARAEFDQKYPENGVANQNSNVSNPTMQMKRVFGTPNIPNIIGANLLTFGLSAFANAKNEGIKKAFMQKQMNDPGFNGSYSNGQNDYGVDPYEQTGQLRKPQFQYGGIQDMLNAKGVDGSKANRTKLFNKYFNNNYTGTAEQNIQLMNDIKSGKISLPNSKPNVGSIGRDVLNRPAVKPQPVAKVQLKKVGAKAILDTPKVEKVVSGVISNSLKTQIKNPDNYKIIPNKLESGWFTDRTTGNTYPIMNGKAGQPVRTITGRNSYGYKNPFVPIKDAASIENHPENMSSVPGNYLVYPNGQNVNSANMRMYKNMRKMEPISVSGVPKPDASGLMFYQARDNHKNDFQNFTPEQYQKQMMSSGTHGCLGFNCNDNGADFKRLDSVNYGTDTLTIGETLKPEWRALAKSYGIPGFAMGGKFDPIEYLYNDDEEVNTIKTKADNQAKKKRITEDEADNTDALLASYELSAEDIVGMDGPIRGRRTRNNNISSGMSSGVGMPSFMPSGKINSGIAEMFYDPIKLNYNNKRGFKNTAFGNHANHGHFATADPVLMKNAKDLARFMGLNIREDGEYDQQVDPVHAKNSYHYQKIGKSRAAMDINGDPQKIKAFFDNVQNFQQGGTYSVDFDTMMKLKAKGIKFKIIE